MDVKNYRYHSRVECMINEGTEQVRKEKRRENRQFESITNLKTKSST